MEPAALIRDLEDLRDRIPEVPTLEQVLAVETRLEALLAALPSPQASLQALEALEALEAREEEEARVGAVLSAAVAQIGARTALGSRLLPPLSLAALCAPAGLLGRHGGVRIGVRADLPVGMYARSLPYRGRIELSPPSERFWGPRYHLEALCRGALPLEVRALQHELVHLQQVQARRELLWIGGMALVPLLWPVLVYALLARVHPWTARHFLAAQEVQAHLEELEHGEQPELAPQRAMVALAAYPFARHLEPGALEAITAWLVALLALGVEGAALSAVLRQMRPGQGLSALAAAVRTRCAARGWGEEALRRAVVGRALRLRVDRALVRALAHQALEGCVE